MIDELLMKTIRRVKMTDGGAPYVVEEKIPQKVVFKIKYGYEATDFLLTESLDVVAKAMYAKAERIGFTHAGKFISGQEVKTIEPDMHTYTGWHRDYKPMSADDFKQIERDVPPILYQLLDEVAKRVSSHLNKGNAELIGNEGLTPESLLDLKKFSPSYTTQQLDTIKTEE